METQPQYQRIALSIAARIAEGDILPGTKLFGRSTLSSEYAVSPETVRRAVKLLSDMKVLEVKENSGVFILSADNARRYLHSVQGKSEQDDGYARLKFLFEQHRRLEEEILRVYEEKKREEMYRSGAEEVFQPYRVRVGEHSDKIGKSIRDMRFWQSTGATVIAILRGGTRILSPGPLMELYPMDVVLFIGEESAAQRVEHFLNGPQQP